MSISQRIIESKNGNSQSERFNMSAKLYDYIVNIDDRKNDLEYLKLIPTLIVASNESFFKETFSSLVNFNQIYLEKSKDLIKRNSIKPDLIDIFHVEKQQITIGDIVAYSLKYSAFDIIYNNLSSITSLDVFSIYEKSPFSIVEYLDLTDSILDDVSIDKSRIFKNLNEVYELRHSICHDFLDNIAKKNLNFEKIKEYLVDCFLMQELTTVIISEHIHMTYSEMNYQEKIKEKEDLLQGLYNEIEKDFFEDIQYSRFTKNKNLFKQYLEQDAICFGYGFRDLGHEDLPFDTLVYQHKLQLLEYRIKLLTEFIEDSK